MRYFYVQTYARCGSYVIGIYVAQLLRNDKKRDYQKRISAILEWIAFIIFIGTFWIPNEVNDLTNHVVWARLLQFSYRYVFSSCLGIMILLMLSPAADTKIDIWRPSKYFRDFLSLNIWLPIATLSYSIYIWHPTIMVPLSKILYTAPAESLGNLSYKTDCKSIVNIGL